MCWNSRCIFASGAAVCTAGGLLFAIFACMYIPPYDYTKNFESMTCTVVSSALLGNVCCKSLDYDGSCDEPYPCLQVQVTYTGNSVPSTSAQVYYDYEAAVYQGDNGSVSKLPYMILYTTIRIALWAKHATWFYIQPKLININILQL